jgi:hypothetical protein
MSVRSQSPLGVGQVLEIALPQFTPRITVHSERELTVEIIAGDGVGFSEWSGALLHRRVRAQLERERRARLW